MPTVASTSMDWDIAFNQWTEFYEIEIPKVGDGRFLAIEVLDEGEEATVGRDEVLNSGFLC